MVFLPTLLRSPFATGARRFASQAGGPFDVVIIGGGPGGYYAAIKAAQLGLKTACVENRGALGGCCLNVGCIPSKALLHSSHLFHEAIKTFPKHGVIASDVSLDLGAMMGQKDTAVAGLTKGIEGLFKKNKVTYVKGTGKVTAKGEVTVDLLEGGSEKISTKNIVIATGSEPTELPFLKFDEKVVVSSTGALSLPKVPKHLICVGAGIIGLELGSVWKRLGAKVTVVEYLDRICPTFDLEISKTMQKSLEKQGLEFMFGQAVTGAEVRSDGVTLKYKPSKGGEEKTLEGDVAMVCIGRKPHTKSLQLEKLGINLDEKGRVVVDKNFKTNVDGVYAIGDCIAGPMLAHKAEEDGGALAEHLAGKGGHVNYATIPNVLYTEPEVGYVGLTEEEVKEKGIKYRVGKFPFQANSRARALGNAEGMVKIIADAETDRVLGVHIIGSSAGELIAEAVLAMEYGASSEDIARTCHAHPTLSEAVKEAAMATYDKPVHF